jgi:DNA-binding beta-propeller fold protein YncE
VIDGSTNQVVGSILVGSGPSSVAFNPSNGYVYVANSDSNTISIISSDISPVPEFNAGSVLIVTLATFSVLALALNRMRVNGAAA